MPRSGGLRLRRLGREHRHHAAVAAGARVLHGAVDEREQREVLPLADVLAGVDLRAELADEDVAGLDLLRAVHLHAAPLARGVAAVARGALSFFVSHGASSFLRYARTTVMRSSVKGCRWPRFFVQPSFFLRKWITFLCLPAETISASTAAPATVGAPTV